MKLIFQRITIWLYIVSYTRCGRQSFGEGQAWAFEAMAKVRVAPSFVTLPMGSIGGLVDLERKQRSLHTLLLIDPSADNQEKLLVYNFFAQQMIFYKRSVRLFHGHGKRTLA